MAFDPGSVEAVTFDSFSTLVDVGSTAGAVADHVDHPARAARTWRIQSLIYAFSCTAMDTYESYWDLCEYALEYALAEQGVTLTGEAFDEVMAVYHDLDAFDDVRPGVERLVEAGYDCYVVSNGDTAMIDSLLAAADIEELIADTVSAGDVEAYKPAPAIYAEAVARTGVDPSAIAHATAAQIDVLGGQHVGMQGVWLNRHERPRTAFGARPDAELPTVTALAEQLGA